MILLVNQHTVPVFTDVVNAFAGKTETRLFTGYIEEGRVPLSHEVQKIDGVAYNRKSTTSRLLSWILFSVHYFFYLCFCKKPACILVVSNPPMAPFITAMIAGIRGIPFYVIIFDLYPEALQQAGMSSEKSFIYKRWQHNNRWTFAKAKGIITLSESMKNAVARYVDAGKIHVIFNWADTDYIMPIDKAKNAFITTHQLQDKIVVMYSGNMGLTHDLESLVEAAAILSENPNIVFVMIGEGGKRRKLESTVADRQLKNVLFLPYQEAGEFPLAMAAADIGIVTLGTGGEGISVPSKTYVNMAAGLAIIAVSPPGSELNRIVSQFSIGYSVAPGQPQQLADHILALATDPQKLQQFKTNARLASLTFTSANAQRYVELINLKS